MAHRNRWFCQAFLLKGNYSPPAKPTHPAYVLHPDLVKNKILDLQVPVPNVSVFVLCLPCAVYSYVTHLLW